MPSVFISYSRKDVSDVREVEHGLAKHGIECWRDERQIEPGEDFAHSIAEAIRARDFFVVVLSAQSMASEYVRKEIALASHFKKRIIPLRLHQTEIPPALLPDLIRLNIWELSQRPPEALARWMLSQAGPSTEAQRDGLGEGHDLARPRAEPSTQSSTGLITRAQFRSFLDQGQGYGAPRWPAVDPRRSGAASSPITSVSWPEALAFCDWTGCRLPSLEDRPLDLAGEGQNDGPVRLEWCDAGTADQKLVRDLHDFEHTQLVDGSSRRRDLGFRALPARSAPLRQWVQIDSGSACLGVDPSALRDLGALVGVPPHALQTMLGRTRREHQIHGFAMTRACVTNDEYYAFTRATGHPWPSHWHARWIRLRAQPFPARLGAQPVVHITVEQARAYCTWSRTRLPTWAEWERAAAGPSAHSYPWGHDFDPRRCNGTESGQGALIDIDAYPSGDTPEGLRQMSGNVAEWVIGPSGTPELRGGSYRRPCEFWGLTHAFWIPPTGHSAPDAGFRVVLDN